MGVKINTKRKLDSNAYSKIIIKKDDDYYVKVTSDKREEQYEFVSYKLSNMIKNSDDNSKIISIIDSFLENTLINFIDVNTSCVGCSGKFIRVSGTRDLYLQISDKELLKEILIMIKNKYDRDRYSYIISSDINSYNINLNKDVSYFNREFISCDNCEYNIDCGKNNDCCPKHIRLRLMYENGKLVSFEEDFIKRFIYDKLWESGVEASITCETEDIKVGGTFKIGTYVKGYLIRCGDLEIMFNCSTFSREYVYNLCNNIVSKYNRELIDNDKKIKKRQLKMEGF